MLQGIFFLIYSVSFAQMNLGFYPKNTADVPVVVHEAGAKIFKISMPYYYPFNESEYDGLLSGPSVPQDTKDAITVCKKQNAKTCMAPFSMIQGTAFLGRTPETVWTNCHIVNAWMGFAGKDQTFTKSSQVREFFAGQNVPLELRDHDGNVVFSKSDGAWMKTFATVPNFPNVDSACNAQDDMVKIRLSRPLAKDGLPWATEKSSLLFMGGFPRKTETREPMGFLDSDGSGFYWTLGPTLDKESSEGKTYMEKHALSIVLSGPYVELSLADGVEGMSGSPILNEKGEVLGIYKGYLPFSEEQKDIPYVSLYFSNGGMRFLEILSGE